MGYVGCMETHTTAEKYAQLQALLNEQQWRQYLALEAQDRGTIAGVARDAGVSRNTVKRGLRDVAAGDTYRPGARIRKAGGGRKKLVDRDATLLADLEQELDPKGDPMRLVQWTTKSVAHLTTALAAKGHRIQRTAVAKVLYDLGFSLRANKKTIEGTPPPDRDAQFGQINRTCKAYEQRGEPIISVDCKKKELIGAFKNNGREWQAQGSDTRVNVYDFLSLADGKAVPYGVYDLVHNRGFVNVGIDHDTAEFAVESIRRWWQTCGQELYPNARQLLITADSGGSNGARTRLWKQRLQAFANEAQLAITVAHYPPATSKWNKIEHRLFAYISINWRAKPLTSLETIIELISHTTTTAGLQVTAVKDSHTYPTGVKVSDAAMEALNISRDTFHGEWNYTIRPQTA
jgi:transposase